MTDDGPGVPPEQLAQLFVPFSTAWFGSTGPSLALADKLARMHRGRVHAEKLAHGGFRVSVVLGGTGPPGE